MNHSNAATSLNRREFCTSTLAAAGALGAVGLTCESLLAQPAAKRAPAPKVKEPKPLTLQTRDGVALRAVYFPGSRGKETVPIIMVHGWEDRGVVWEPLAAFFQRNFGHAVIVPDLRGHGQSLTQQNPRGGEPRNLKPDDLTPVDMEAMKWDLQACKKHLEDENNAGELNIEMLCVIGAEFGALVAMQFAAMDWSWPVLTTGKQGQDVKALALLTPIDRFKRFSAAPTLPALRAPIASGRFSMLIIAGEQDRSGYSDAKRLHRQFETMFPKTDDNGLMLVTPPTNSHGAQLIEPQRRLGMERVLTDFIAQRLVARKSDFEWAERRSPLAR